MSCFLHTEQENQPTPVATAVRSALKHCNATPRTYPEDADILHQGDRPKFVYLVSTGWLYSYAVLADGQRQILYLHTAGDMAGFVDLGSERAICSLRCLRDCVLHPIPISAFTSPSFLTPAIATFFLHKSAEMQSILLRTLTAIGRMGARQRLIWLLLMLHDRLHAEFLHDEIELPLNQSELGDLIGLTNVSISKNLCQLSVEGLIERKGSKVLLRRRAAMERLIDYQAMRFPPDLLRQDRSFDPLNRATPHQHPPEPAISQRVLQAHLDNLKGWDGS